MSSDQRPTNTYPTDLMRYRWPITALASITHRITGIILFVGVGIALYLLDLATASDASHEQARALLATPLVKLVLWGALSALAYHVIAGIKHMFMDFGIGETLQGGRLWAQSTLLLAALVIAALGVWAWGW